MTLTRETLIRGLKNVLTLALAALAALVLWHLYDYYTYAPQTRDGKLRADVVPLAAAVSGRVDSVAIHDGQVVEKGPLLFTIDKVRLRTALDRTRVVSGKSVSVRFSFGGRRLFKKKKQT